MFFFYLSCSKTIRLVQPHLHIFLRVAESRGDKQDLKGLEKSRPIARFRIEGKKLGIFLGNKGTLLSLTFNSKTI